MHLQRPRRSNGRKNESNGEREIPSSIRGLHSFTGTMMNLVLCPSCQRLVRAAEAMCPFCHGRSLLAIRARSAPRPVIRASRAACLASLAVASTFVPALGCSSPEPADHPTATLESGPYAGWTAVACSSAPPTDPGNHPVEIPCGCVACDRATEICVAVDAHDGDAKPDVNMLQCHPRGAPFVPSAEVSAVVAESIGRIGDQCGSMPSCACIVVAKLAAGALGGDSRSDGLPYVEEYTCAEREGGGVAVLVHTWPVPAISAGCYGCPPPRLERLAPRDGVTGDGLGRLKREVA
jgi:hypothetical protein